jgi:hypothetical protein
VDEAQRPRGWIGVDLDGTLAHYHGWKHVGHIGDPVPEMLDRVKRWLAEGYEVRIFTARIYPAGFSAPGMSGRETPSIHGVAFSRPGDRSVEREADQAIDAVRAWVIEHVGVDLAITCIKDMAMLELWDDRAVQVHPNTGQPVGHSTRGLV